MDTILSRLLQDINPVAFRVGIVEVRWYGIVYAIFMILCAYRLKKSCQRFAQTNPSVVEVSTDALMMYIALGIVLGGRIGYVLFYNASWLYQDPLQLFKVWEGGMSFHGALLGIGLSLYIFCQLYKYPFLWLTDQASVLAPWAIFFGRIANFINGELYGTKSNLPWSVVFPHVGPEKRHPNQLYEAILEGLALGVVLLLAKKQLRGSNGATTALFLIGYSFARLFTEQFREQSFNTLLQPSVMTYGQLLTLPLLLVGVGLAFKAWNEKL